MRNPLAARVLEARPGGLTVELDAGARARRGRAELVWAEPRGLARLRGRVWLVKPGPPPVVDLRFDRPPELTQRRQHVRVDMQVPFKAWSLVEPTRLLSGTTLNLSGGGALVQLPELPPAATVLEVTLSLPDGPLGVRAQVVRQDDGGVVALAFGELGDEEGRLSSLAMQRFEGPAPPDPPPS